MYIYWFSDDEGSNWAIIAAKSANSAWQKLAESQVAKSGGPGDHMTVNEAQKEYKLSAQTEINEAEGRIATIFPREVYFSIYKAPGGELSGMTNY